MTFEHMRGNLIAYLSECPADTVSHGWRGYDVRIHHSGGFSGYRSPSKSFRVVIVVENIPVQEGSVKRVGLALDAKTSEPIL